MSRIAYRYAKSLLDLCIERNEVDRVSQDMNFLNQSIHESRDLALLLKSPVVKGDAKAKILDKIFGQQVHGTTHQFMKLMIEKGRESFLGDVSSSFIDLVRVHRNEVLAEVTTAVKMDDATRKEVLVAAQALTKNKIELTEQVNPDLIGGFIVRVGDQQIDTSIAQQLKQLKREFSENEYIPEL
jgi:F-type H+-transporting ATPase subunit delta